MEVEVLVLTDLAEELATESLSSHTTTSLVIIGLLHLMPISGTQETFQQNCN